MITQFQILAQDNTSGATELIHRLLALCENCTIGQSFDEMKEGLELLDKAQVSMPSLHTVIHILKSDLLTSLDSGKDTEAALSYIISLQKILEESGENIAANFADLLKGPTSILTLSRSSTVISGLKHCMEQHKLSQLYVMESRPMNEGWKTIRDCSSLGIKSTLLIDAAMTEALRKVDCVVAGADSISSDGYLLNKTGSNALAICAKEFDVPFYVMCDSLKFSPQTRDHVTLEERPVSEVIELDEDDSFEIWNRYFEWVPINLVTEFITERGIFTPDKLSALNTDSEQA
jgi:translation initiation factor 2B subunit (eIF-2B alpha/beta/delta family)